MCASIDRRGCNLFAHLNESCALYPAALLITETQNARVGKNIHHDSKSILMRGAIELKGALLCLRVLLCESSYRKFCTTWPREVLGMQFGSKERR